MPVPADNPLNDGAYIEEIRGQMLKFARLQLRDADAAEDAVQDALIGAMKNAGKFAGRAAFKSWVFAILKHKIIDGIRKNGKYVALSAIQGDEDENGDASYLFDESGHWADDHAPSSWRTPEQSFKQQQFWAIFEACLGKLPAAQARCFMMREFIGLDSAEICKELALSTTNLHVLLHRARLGLQKCLDTKWFKDNHHA
jgi:RNA polymerase sigma-70 factor (ECF subfamily)